MAVPAGWTPVVHPEGSRYFVNQEKVRSGYLPMRSHLTRGHDAQRILTESNICDPISHQEIEYGIKVLLGWLEPGELDMNQVDLVIESKVDDDNNLVFCYYFVNHHSRCIFWLYDFDAEDVLSDCQGVLNLSHKGR